MAKNNRQDPLRSPKQLREISDYYKLNTKAVEDLAGANSENSPKVSPEELQKYRSKSGISLPMWLRGTAVIKTSTAIIIAANKSILRIVMVRLPEIQL